MKKYYSLIGICFIALSITSCSKKNNDCSNCPAPGNGPVTPGISNEIVYDSLVWQFYDEPNTIGSSFDMVYLHGVDSNGTIPNSIRNGMEVFIKRTRNGNWEQALPFYTPASHLFHLNAAGVIVEINPIDLSMVGQAGSLKVRF